MTTQHKANQTMTHKNKSTLHSAGTFGVTNSAGISLHGIKHLVGWFLALPRNIKQAILIISDYIASIFCLFISLALRYDSFAFHISPMKLAAYALIPIIGLYAIRFYKGVSRVFFDTDMRRVLMLFVGLLIVFAFTNIAGWSKDLPRSVPLIHLFLLLIWVWSSRLTLYVLLTKSQGKSIKNNGNSDHLDNVIIYGAGSSGKELFEALQVSNRYDVVAFVDDDSRLTGGRILGKQIYLASDLKALVKDLKVSQVFLAMPSIPRARRREIIDGLTNISIKIKELPSLQEIAEGKVTVSTMRRVDILDVLDRQTVEPDTQLLHQDIKDKSVVVTGAGGSIGSELCRQILKNKPRCLVLYELSEYALYSIHQELMVQQKDIPLAEQIHIVALIGNVTNEDKLRDVFERYYIDTVYHAAAYKHVPIVEHNPFEGAINNTKGTYHCVKAAIEAHVATFVLISTDKAVRPTNIMGASKRLAELVCQGFSNELLKNSGSQKSPTRISMVRFGNVLGSSGSVVPLFTRQIEQGGPITVTHPDVTRYFMTIPEAANLVIQAGAMAKGGEVFVLDMGKPVKIVDLARRMIHLSGFNVKEDSNPEGDIEIVFTGLRPGEKLYEELIIGEDNVETTHHPLIMQAIEHSFPLSSIENTINEFAQRAQNHDTKWLKQQFKHYVEGYQENKTT